MILSFANTSFYTEPYPHGLAADVFEPDVYAAMVAAFPLDIPNFVEFGAGNRKWSLSECNNPAGYHAFVFGHPLWSKLHAEIKSEEFADRVFDVIGVHITRVPSRARFEFSVLPADGGCLRPHRDITSKIITLVIPMVRLNEWKPEWGGGTDLLVPASTNNLVDYHAEFDAFNISKTVPYTPNQAFIFLRSDKSWHSVGPIKGPRGKTRRTLTVNLETI